MKFVWKILALSPLFFLSANGADEPKAQSQILRDILEVTQPLRTPRGNRLPLFLWGAIDIGVPGEKETESILRRLDERGIGAITTWNYQNKESSLAEGLRIARLQKKLGLGVNVNATSCLSQFFNGDERTAHITETGQPFFDSSFDAGVKMGCPFALDFRKPDIKAQLDFFARAYHEQNLPVNFIFADWEVDGPIEWNGAWESSKRCRRCREQIMGIEDFSVFQKVVRTLRSELQREVFAGPIKSYFPKALVGNYAVNPHSGYRYWYDYFEKLSEGAPYQSDQRAKYRKWFPEFPLTGYTFAMPVLYTWYPTFQWYDFKNPDYHWFYNLLLEATSAASNTPRNVPIIPFVHWHTTEPPKNADATVKQFSEEKYQELLWHILLRGGDSFFLWCPSNETLKEVELLHAVYAESLQYRDFLDRGDPITFEVPRREGPVISGLRLGQRVLVRRTDFNDDPAPVNLKVGATKIRVKRLPGKCQILKLPP